MTAAAVPGPVGAVALALDAAGFAYEVIPHTPGRPRVLRMQVVDEDGHLVVLFFARDDDELVSGTAHFSGAVPADRRRAVAEAMLHVNAGLRSGAFVIGLDDGSARFFTAAVVQADEPVPAVAMLMTCWNTAARFRKVLDAVVLEGHSADRAVTTHW